MIILFPSSVKDKNIIDPEFRSEAAAVIETGNRILLFDQKEWLQNKKIILSQNKIEVNQDTVIYLTCEIIIWVNVCPTQVQVTTVINHLDVILFPIIF